MSSIDVSKTLGEYMLRGWVMTADTCTRENCSVPLMRSPKNHVPVTTFCANCDGTPDAVAGPSSARPRTESTTQSPSSYTSNNTEEMSRPSTPPTDISSALSSPTFALPVETAESVRRRQQSDAASEEIGKRLLKGWAMLADECPNPRCFGVPLVRPPLAGGKDPKKECVTCGTIYIDEKDAAGWAHLVAEPSRQNAIAGPGPSSTSSAPLKESGKKEKEKERATLSNVLGLDELTTEPPNKAKVQDLMVALRVSSDVLNEALQALAQRLSTLTSNAAFDTASIANTADAMSKVLDALTRAKALIGETAH